MSRIPTTLFFSKGVNSVPRADLVILPSAILKKLSVILSEVSLIGINLLDRVLGMTTAGNTERKVGSVMVGSGTHFGGTDKSIVGTVSSVLLKPEMRDVILDRPARFDSTGEFQDISIFHLYQNARQCLSFLFLSSSFSLLVGCLAESTNRASTATPSLMVKPLAANWLRTSVLIIRMDIYYTPKHGS